MKFSGKIEDGTSNESLNFGSDPWPWRRFMLSECTLRAKICALRVPLVKYATEWHDHETLTKKQNILAPQGANTSERVHQGCYCSFTSTDHIQKALSVMKDQLPESSDDSEWVSFKKKCLVCAASHVPVNPKHPDRWDRILQCKRKGVKVLDLSKMLYYSTVKIKSMCGVGKLLCTVMVYMI